MTDDADDYTPTAELRWFIPAGKPDHALPRLQQLWRKLPSIDDPEPASTEWRDVPTVYEGAGE